jgi:hypothetical protein
MKEKTLRIALGSAIFVDGWLCTPHALDFPWDKWTVFLHPDQRRDNPCPVLATAP